MKLSKIILTGLFLTLTTNALAEGDATAGKAKFETYCGSCHGNTGAGDGPASSALNPKPRNLQDTAYMGAKTDDHLKKVIAEGGPAVGLSASMPAWKAALNDQDILNVIAYIRSLAKK